MQKDSQSTNNLNQNAKQINRQTSFHSSSNPSSTTAIQDLATQPNSVNVIIEFSGGENDSPTRKRTKLVDSKYKSIQWKICNNSPSPNNYKLGCLEQRLGGIMIRATHGGSLDMRKKEIIHKQARIKGSQIDTNDINNLTKCRNFNLFKDGQHGGMALSNEDGRDNKTGNSVN